MYTNDRRAYREKYFLTWQKYCNKQPVDNLEAQLIEIIIAHPHYHSVLNNPDDYSNFDFHHEENPFLHLSLHQAIREQLNTNRPNGIKEIFVALLNKYQDRHIVEHKLIEYLTETLQHAQQQGKMPSDAEYLEGIKRLL